MRYSKLFPHAKREVVAESVNHRLLVQAGFMDQLMSGSWTLLPLGWKVVTNLAFVVHDHLEVLDESKKAAPKMVKLLTNIVKSI